MKHISIKNVVYVLLFVAAMYIVFWLNVWAEAVVRPWLASFW